MKMVVLENNSYNSVVPESIPTGVPIKGFKRYREHFEVMGKHLIEAGADPEHVDEDFYYFFRKDSVKKV